MTEASTMLLSSTDVLNTIPMTQNALSGVPSEDVVQTRFHPLQTFWVQLLHVQFQTNLVPSTSISNRTA